MHHVLCTVPRSEYCLREESDDLYRSYDDAHSFISVAGVHII